MMNRIGQKRRWPVVAVAAITIAVLALLAASGHGPGSEHSWTACLPAVFVGLIVPLNLVVAVDGSIRKAVAAPVLGPLFQRPPPPSLG